MKRITISPEDRRFSATSITVGYLQENKAEKIEFDIPEEYKDYGRKACFEADGKTFAKLFDDVTGNTITFTRDFTQYKNLKMTIAFFKSNNEDEIVARTSILNIFIENAIICDDDIKPDDPKIIALDDLIAKVTKLNNEVEANENIRIQNENAREDNEKVRISNENIRIVSENSRISNEKDREEYINGLKEKVDRGEFNGADFNYNWNGTKLGVKNSKETEYIYTDLKGEQGEKGDVGDFNFATFEIDLATGNLIANKTENLQLIDFAIRNGNLEVIING